MKLSGILFFSFFLSVSLSAQEESVKYKFRVYLKDKGSSSFSVSEPEKFLTSKAIERKKRQEAAIDQTDFPISPDYFHALKNAGGKIVSYSKWFSTIVIELPDSSQVENILNLPFVASAQYVWRGQQRKWNHTRQRLALQDCFEENRQENPFGITEKQFELHNARSLFTNGYTGRGIAIAIIDGGFKNADVIPFFGNIRVRGTKNFAPDGDLYTSTDHGTKVLPTLAVNVPHVIMGSASESEFYLFRSEDETSEFPVEEDYWIRAVEYADSLGIDLINTSLGYTTFDDPDLNYRHSHLDGKSSLMSRASDKAVEKGMFLVTSAGNEGRKPWQKISPPADAVHVLTVGAASDEGKFAGFSSKGYTADHRVKPDVVSVGEKTIVVGSRGVIELSNGTSFSAPFMAGLVASLWSINPSISRYEIIDIVRKSSDRYNQPDTLYGYGIPDFGKAMRIMLQTHPASPDSITEEDFSVSRPDSKTLVFTLNNPPLQNRNPRISLLDEAGNLLQSIQLESTTAEIQLPDGEKTRNEFVYLVFTSNRTQRTFRFKLYNR